LLRRSIEARERAERKLTLARGEPGDGGGHVRRPMPRPTTCSSTPPSNRDGRRRSKTPLGRPSPIRGALPHGTEIVATDARHRQHHFV
jgi:hypothetical protein